MKSLLSKIKPTDIFSEPFPHIVIKDALDEEVYSKLKSEWADIEILRQGEDNKGTDLSSNKRLHYLAQESLNDERITPFWKEFIALHTSDTFFQEFLTIFKDYILQMYPDFEQKYGSFATLKSGLRKVDTFESVDVLLDALICINTPVITKPNAVRGAHIDLPDKLFAGLFYLRDPQDTSTGGNLEIYKFKNGKPYGFRSSAIDDSYIKHVKTIEYDRNVLILFLNSVYSLHGVSVRSLTESPRYFVNLVGEVKQPLFNPKQYQELPSFKTKYIRKLENAIKKVALAAK
ncbi:hypothetical protein C7Y66_05890 [Chroococcidiopsis sp. CCALA 051]|uniref:2OG-Fe(II) oxygenase n=1 Tax=Chroococcidiopsis sp. CCALA 051 TaxID=869949 RepID=UPI000D0DC223|nr:2OG-Fe(II) oxygenase [Chroococcidiopsis sp. CCALA 051]PSM50068.1 hypothetical protein C7Y66_05890 [Chroococcidiopsis sp. CCALA 051]